METRALQTIHTSCGTFVIDQVRDKKMARALESGAYPNEAFLDLVRAFVDKKDVVIDIGAHIGTFSLPVASIAEKVISVEPFPESFALLSRNAAENNVPLQLLNKALGRKKGSGTIMVRSASNAGANTLIAGGDIPVTTLDDEITHADFIKIDVEGMELDVLLGGVALIERVRPVVLFEVNLSQLRAHGASPGALERFFLKRGYRLYVSLERGDGALARVRNATLLTAFIAPRAWLFFGDSAPFDLIAVPQERRVSLPIVGFTVALLAALKNNLLVKMHRLRAWFGYHTYDRSD